MEGIGRFCDWNKINAMHLDMNVLTCPFSKKELLAFNLDYCLFVLLTKKEYSWLINYRPPSVEHRLIFIIPGQSNNYLPQCQKKTGNNYLPQKKSKLLNIPTNVVPPPYIFFLSLLLKLMKVVNIHVIRCLASHTSSWWPIFFFPIMASSKNRPNSYL